MLQYREPLAEQTLQCLSVYVVVHARIWTDPQQHSKALNRESGMLSLRIDSARFA